jgi:iron-sulfur cluster assembly protein
MAKEVSKVTKFWPINKILEVFPDSVELMKEIGLHCFGCNANAIERLNEGMATHGFTEEEIDDFVEKLNSEFQKYKQTKLRKPTQTDKNVEVIQEANTTYYKAAGLLFNQTAYDALHELLEDFKGLQIRLDAGGCSGYTYIYDFTNSPQDDEDIYHLSDKLELYMNDFTFDKIYGTMVDFKFGIKDAGLKFTNPNTKDACHCGTSVGF